MTLKLGVPSKGRLMEKTFDWFAKRGITLSRTGSDREYAGSVEGVENVSLVLLSASEIPRELAAGRIHLGVTGTDLVQEKLPLWEQQVEPLEQMGFGHADLVLAVPQAWVDVDLTDDLDAAAAAFRAAHGFRLRIATKYHRLVREFLRDAGVADYLQKPWPLDDLFHLISGRIQVCVDCGLELPLKRPQSGQQGQTWVCAGCGSRYLAILDPQATQDLRLNVRGE